MPWQVLPFASAQFDAPLLALCRAVPHLDHLLCWIEEAHFPLHQEDRRRRNLHAELARDGRFEIRLPGIGVALRSARSVMLEDKTTFFGLAGRPDLMLAASRIGYGQPLTSVLLPGRRIVLNVHGSRWNVDAEQAARATALFASHATDWADPGTPPPAPLLVTGDPNYAHHIWNQLGALDAILAEGRSVSVAATHQPIAPLAAIFADRPGLRVRPIAARELPALDPTQTLPHPAGGVVVLAAVRERIARVATRHASPAAHAFLAATEGSRRIWLTVRMVGRTATNQRDALAAILHWLLTDGGFAVVIDGFSRPNDYDRNPDYDRPAIERAIGQETALVDSLLRTVAARLGAAALARVHAAIGADLLESIHLARTCHAYFAHHGTLQHKMGYFTRVPGLVHTNPALLAFDRAGTHRHVTEDPGVVEYIDNALVADAPGAHGAMSEDNDYRFTDIPRLLARLQAFIAQHAPPGRSAPPA